MSAELILAVVGTVGLTTLGSWIGRGRLLGRRHGLLRFQFGQPIDVVLGTSAVLRRDASHAYTRVLTSSGNLESATTFARVIGERRGRNETRIQLSQSISSRLDSDLVLIGGPRRSDSAGRFLEYVAAQYPELALAFGDNTPAPSSMSLGDVHVRYEPREQEAHPEYPQDDYALVIAWVNPFAVVRRRAFLCAGFSSHGTRAATKYLLSEFMHHRRTRWRRSPAAPRASSAHPWARLRNLGRWPCFAMILHVTFDRHEAVDVKEIAFEKLRLPEIPVAPLPMPARADAVVSVAEASA